MPCDMLNASLSILLYLLSVLDRLLLVNVMGLSMLLSGAMSLEKVVSFLVYRRLVPIPAPDASVSGYSGLVSS